MEKGPIYMAKEAYLYGKKGLLIDISNPQDCKSVCEKRPIKPVKETYNLRKETY